LLGFLRFLLTCASSPWTRTVRPQRCRCVARPTFPTNSRRRPSAAAAPAAGGRFATVLAGARTPRSRHQRVTTRHPAARGWSPVRQQCASVPRPRGPRSTQRHRSHSAALAGARNVNSRHW